MPIPPLHSLIINNHSSASRRPRPPRRHPPLLRPSICQRMGRPYARHRERRWFFCVCVCLFCLFSVVFLPQCPFFDVTLHFPFYSFSSFLVTYLFFSFPSFPSAPTPKTNATSFLFQKQWQHQPPKILPLPRKRPARGPHSDR